MEKGPHELTNARTKDDDFFDAFAEQEKSMGKTMRNHLKPNEKEEN